MAAPYGPDVVGLLRDDVSYGVKGDHGGHQRKIQRIPMVFSWPGLRPQRRYERIRSVDVLPTVLRLLHIERMPGHPLDGRAYKLRRRR
jgi:arylsulfatase A-like enzyme